MDENQIDKAKSLFKDYKNADLQKEHHPLFVPFAGFLYATQKDSKYHIESVVSSLNKENKTPYEKENIESHQTLLKHCKQNKDATLEDTPS